MKDPYESGVIKELARKQNRSWLSGLVECCSRLASTGFVLSAGTILALSGTSSILSAFVKTGPWSLHDPVFNLPWRTIIIGFALLDLVISCLCLLTKKQAIVLGLVAWLSTIHAGYRIGLCAMGVPHPWAFVEPFTEDWGLSPFMADCIVTSTIFYLLAGSAFELLRPRAKLKSTPAQDKDYFKIPCPSCGGRIAFTADWAERTTACPHCGNSLLLAKKM
ncbi:MAG TPA: hypothetical protein VFC07_02140 [Verrucomicrobiae bacterium]|nr:hypothetical protein [Verrucomicrobiae bacterium]